jgi:hypothetical protein
MTIDEELEWGSQIAKVAVVILAGLLVFVAWCVAERAWNIDECRAKCRPYGVETCTRNRTVCNLMTRVAE